MAQAFRALETFVFFPPEENVFRLREILNQHQSLEPTSKTQQPVLVTEPVPPPFTLQKLYWGLSLFWSYRGIGWNYACPLPESSRQRPYSRDSPRREFLITRLRKTILIWFCWDLFRTYTNLTPASIYLSGQPGIAPPYVNLAVWEKAIHSILIPARIVLDTERSFLMCSIMMVGIGGVMGWEGELWEPYGWPPLFGTFGDLWTSPGLATMWSKVCTLVSCVIYEADDQTWQGYFRRWLHVLGWIGIGENILGLTHSGESAHPNSKPPTTPKPVSSASLSPVGSGRTSPSHPIPSSNSTRTRTITTRLALSNFLKSLIVFTLSGLVHDCGTMSLILLRTPLDKPLNLDRVLALTPFFVLQPFALVAEAVLKAQYRQRKSKAYPNWRTEGIPRNLVFMERLVGFTLTWVWLGWSAGWFVEGLTKHGMFNRAGNVRLFPSLLGGIFWGKWFH